jgi:nucleotide-binding universal stress UspA family protein
MQKLFNHILVPVDQNNDSRLVIDKAVQVANLFDCDIHLLSVQAPLMSIPFVYEGNLTGSASTEALEESERKLKELADQCRPLLANGLLMTTSVSFGNWYSQIKEQVITKHIDLVVSTGGLLNKIDLNQLAQQTQCPVLTVTEVFDAAHLQNIVVPVNDFLPIKKLAAATYLARRFNGVIHLMGGRGDSYAEDQRKTRSLTRAYQLLNDYTHVKVFCNTQDGHTIADDTLAYAENVKADLIVVNSGKESLLRGWFSKWMGKYLYKKTTIPVLTISQG